MHLIDHLPKLILVLILISPVLILPLTITNETPKIIKVLIIDDNDSPWDVKSMKLLSHLNPSIKFKAIRWKELRSIKLLSYDILIVGSGYSIETLDGICFFLSGVIKYVKMGFNLLILNSIVRFEVSEPKNWWDVEVLKSLSIHYDKPPILTLQKICNKIDKSLKVVNIDENEAFDKYVIKELIPPPRNLLHGVNASILKSLRDFVAFGWFKDFNRSKWITLLYGRTTKGEVVPVMIYTCLGKGHVILTTLFLDRLLIREHRYKLLYDAVFNLCFKP